MRRRLFTILSALSLLLCMAVAAVWIQSHHGGLLLGHWSWQNTGPFVVTEKCWGLFSRNGEVGFADNTYDETHANWVMYVFFRRGGNFDRWGLFITNDLAGSYGPVRDGDDLGAEYGFGWGDVAYTWDGHADNRRFIMVPHWFLLLVSGIPLLRAVFIASRTKLFALRIKDPGLCPSCGYDLRATPERCPECGRKTRSSLTEVNA